MTGPDLPSLTTASPMRTTGIRSLVVEAEKTSQVGRSGLGDLGQAEDLFLDGDPHTVGYLDHMQTSDAAQDPVAQRVGAECPLHEREDVGRTPFAHHTLGAEEQGFVSAGLLRLLFGKHRRQQVGGLDVAPRPAHVLDRVKTGAGKDLGSESGAALARAYASTVGCGGRGNTNSRGAVPLVTWT